jgi:hypothetical protein
LELKQLIKFRQAVGISAVFVLVCLLFTQVVVKASDAYSIEKVALPFLLTLLVSLLSSLNPQYRDKKSIGSHVLPAGIVTVGILVYLSIRAEVSSEPMAWSQVPAVVFGAALSVLLINVLRRVTQ